MTETAKKISRKIRGKPEPTLLIDETDLPEFDQFRDGKWLKKDNVEASVIFGRKPIFQNPPICDVCGEKISSKDVQDVIELKGSLWREICYVAITAQYYAELTKLYDTIRNGKIGLEDAFQQEVLLKEKYFEGKPETERPGVSNAKGSVALDCGKCGARLGLVEVSVKTKIDFPYIPDVQHWVALEKSPRQLRIIKENLLSEGTNYDDWIQGNDMREFIEKLQTWKEEIDKLPFQRELYRPLSNLSADIGTAITKIKEEIQTRDDRVYNLLRNPPTAPPRKPEPLPEKREPPEKSQEFYKKLGAKPIRR